tara:strand:- start:360 stop:2660 length:2301 start_codon:yes stop_codon:yes gene_type:complete
MLIGFAALAVPVIFHFIARHKFPIRDFPSLMLLRKRERPNALSWRPIDLFQLLLRLAVLAILVLAMARGFSPESKEPAPRNLVIILDTSTSMNLPTDPAADKDLSSLKLARQKAKEMLREIKLPSRCALVAAGTEAKILSPLGNAPTKAIAELDKIETGAGAGDNLVRAIALGAEMIRGLREVRSQIVIFTDGRAHSFGKRHPRDLREIAELKQQLGDHLDIVMVDLAQGGAENLAIIQSAVKGRVRLGRDTHVMTRVKNYGTNTSLARVELSLAGEKEPMGREFSLLPGAEAVVDLTARAERRLPQPFAEVSLQLPEGEGAAIRKMNDANSADNRFDLPFITEQVRRILIVDGTDAAGSGLTVLPGQEPGKVDLDDTINGSRILEFVLNPSRELGLAYGTGLRTTRILLEELGNETLSKYDLVILYDVSELSDERKVDLHTFVKEGRSLLLVCSASLNALNFNNKLAAGDDPLSPVQIDNDLKLDPGSVILFDTKRHDIEGIPYVPHALVSHFLNLRSGDLSLVSFNTLRGVRGFSKDARILLRDDQNHPLIIDRPLGDGVVAVTTFGMELGRGNLAMSRVFPLLAWTLVDHLTGQLKVKPSFSLTALRAVSLDVSEPGFAFMDKLQLRHEENLDEVRTMDVAKGRSVKVEGMPPGRYLLGKPWRGSKQWSGYRRPVTVNNDPLESDLTKIDDAQLQTWFKDAVQTKTVPELAQLTPKGREQWRLFILILAAAWVLEAVAGYVTSLLRWRKQEAEQERELREEST